MQRAGILLVPSALLIPIPTSNRTQNKKGCHRRHLRLSISPGIAYKESRTLPSLECRGSDLRYAIKNNKFNNDKSIATKYELRVRQTTRLFAGYLI